MAEVVGVVVAFLIIILLIIRVNDVIEARREARENRDRGW